MSQKSDDLRKSLDTLVELFKRFRDKLNSDDFKHIDNGMFAHINLLINNYDMIKNNFSDDVFEEIGEPLQLMINQAIGQLKMEFGVELYSNKLISNDLSIIDEHLKSPNLTIDEINELLDKRKSIVG